MRNIFAGQTEWFLLSSTFCDTRVSECSCWDEWRHRDSTSNRWRLRVHTKDCRRRSVERLWLLTDSLPCLSSDQATRLLRRATQRQAGWYIRLPTNIFCSWQSLLYTFLLRRKKLIFSCLVNGLIASDASFISDGKLFHSNWPAAEKLDRQKPIVFVFGVAKSLTSANRSQMPTGCDCHHWSEQ